MKTKKIIVVVASIIVAFALPGCRTEEKSKTEEPRSNRKEVLTLSAESKKQIKLETETVSLKPFTGYLTIPAKVVTNQDNEALIGSLVQGRVHQVFAKVGDNVKAGQIVMTVEGLYIGEIKSGFLKAKASLEYAKSNFERQNKLFDENIGSRKSFLESKAEYEKALAEYKAEDKKIHSVGLSDADISDAGKNDEHTSGTLPIKSPINGIVVERNVVIGQFVDATTNAFKVINTHSVWVDGQLYEKDISKIHTKTKSSFTSATYQNEVFQGDIIYIGEMVDPQTRTITVRGEFMNGNSKLKPQMFGELKIPVDANAKAFLVSDEAVVRDAGAEYVFIQLSDTTFEQRKVVTGYSLDNRTEIKDGLKEGDRVVSRGVYYLKSELKKEEIGGE